MVVAGGQMDTVVSPDPRLRGDTAELRYGWSQLCGSRVFLLVQHSLVPLTPFPPDRDDLKEP